MLWLRAYARKCRWDEESVLVPFEMDSTVWYFGTQSGRWRQWAENGGTPGHKAYAFRQSSMWASLRDHASDAFAKAQRMYSLEPEVPST